MDPYRSSGLSGRLRTAGRRTNAALLAVLGLSLATGTVAYAVGSSPATILVTLAHAAVGLALVLLVPWKQAIARRGLRAPAHAGRTSGLLLAGLLTVTVLAGVVQEAVGWTATPVSPLQLHVVSALLAVPLVVRHLVTHWQPLRRVDASRRALLSTGVLAAGGLGAAVAVDALTRVLRLPGGHDRGTGSTQRGSYVPQAMPVTQWFTDGVPALPVGPVRIVVDGLTTEVDPGVLPFEELDAVLDCTGGWYAAQRWGGTRLDRLLPDDLPGGARSVTVVSSTGYRRRFPLRDASRLLLASAAGGEPLSPGHGAPYRLVAPGRRGFWWVKWVVAVEVGDEPAWLQPPFPLQ